MEYIIQHMLPSMLGDYILGIDSDHMKTDFFSGKVSLQGLAINPAIVKSFNLPFKIVYSNISTLNVKIPWMQRLKKPTKIDIDNVQVVLEATTVTDSVDVFKERLRFLNILTEECRAKMRALIQENKKDETTIDHCRTLILDNFQLIIKNIHIRFEDQKKGYAFGFTLDEVHVYTTNQAGQREFLDRTLKENKMKDVYKKLIMQNIGFYWNPQENQEAFLSQTKYSNDQKRAFLKDRTLLEKNANSNIKPIFLITLESSLIIKCLEKPNDDAEPRYRLEIELKPMDINLDSIQVAQMMSLIDSVMVIMAESQRKEDVAEISEEQKQMDTVLYRKAMTDLLMTIKNNDFRWDEELCGLPRKAQADAVKNLLLKIPDGVVTLVSGETILKDEKRRLLDQADKKMATKRLLNFWKQDALLKKDNEELGKLGEFYDVFIQENIDKLGNEIKKGLILQVNLKLSEASVLLMTTESNMKSGTLTLMKGPSIKYQFYQNETHDTTKMDLMLQDIQMSMHTKTLEENSNREVTIMTKLSQTETANRVSVALNALNYHEKKDQIELTKDEILANLIGRVANKVEDTSPVNETSPSPTNSSVDISSVVKKNYISSETVEASPNKDSNSEWQRISQNDKGFPEKQEEDIKQKEDTKQKEDAKQKEETKQKEEAKQKLEEQDKIIAALRKELLEERTQKDQLMKILEIKCMEIAGLKSKAMHK